MMKYATLPIICLISALLTNSSPAPQVVEDCTPIVDTIKVIQENEAVFTLPQMSPLPDSFKIGSRFNPRRMHPALRIIRPHNGVDMGCPVGTPIYAQGNGVVDRVEYNTWSGYGNNITISHGMNLEKEEVTLRYAHLSRIEVKPNQQVKMGDLIGYTGNTGLSTAPHLHFEYRLDDKPMNPIKYLCFDKAELDRLRSFSDSTQQMLFEEEYEFHQLEREEAIAVSNRIGSISG